MQLMPLLHAIQSFRYSAVDCVSGRNIVFVGNVWSGKAANMLFFRLSSGRKANENKKPRTKPDRWTSDSCCELLELSDAHLETRMLQ